MMGAEFAATKTHDAVQMKGTQMTKRQPFAKHKALMHLACASFYSDLLLRVKKATGVRPVVCKCFRNTRAASSRTLIAYRFVNTVTADFTSAVAEHIFCTAHGS